MVMSVSVSSPGTVTIRTVLSAGSARLSFPTARNNPKASAAAPAAADAAAIVHERFIFRSSMKILSFVASRSGRHVAGHRVIRTVTGNVDAGPDGAGAGGWAADRGF